MSELSGVRREASRRVHEVNSYNLGEISRCLSTLEGKTVLGEAQFIVTEHFEILF
jgi:hypothetical protein